MKKILFTFLALVSIFYADNLRAQCGSGATIDVTESRCIATGTMTITGATGSGTYIYSFSSYLSYSTT